jgi:hypothetical protein
VPLELCLLSNLAILNLDKNFYLNAPSSSIIKQGSKAIIDYLRLRSQIQ